MSFSAATGVMTGFALASPHSSRRISRCFGSALHKKPSFRRSMRLPKNFNPLRAVDVRALDIVFLFKGLPDPLEILGTFSNSSTCTRLCLTPRGRLFTCRTSGKLKSQQGNRWTTVIHQIRLGTDTKHSAVQNYTLWFKTCFHIPTF